MLLYKNSWKILDFCWNKNQKINLFIVRQSIKKDITKFQKNIKIFKNIFSRINHLGLFINVKIPFLNF